MGKLTNKQRAFVEHYLQCWNASEAARLAGYSEATARAQGARLLTNVDISADVQRRLTELQASADEVLTRLTSHARGSMETFMRVDDDGAASLDLKQAKDAKALHLIKKLKTTTRTIKREDKSDEVIVTNEVELYDAQSALEKLGRTHALFKDRNEISGVNGDAIRVEAVDYRITSFAIAPAEDGSMENRPTPSED